MWLKQPVLVKPQHVRMTWLLSLFTELAHVWFVHAPNQSFRYWTEIWSFSPLVSSAARPENEFEMTAGTRSITRRATVIGLVSADGVKSQLRWLKMQHCMPFFLLLSCSCRVWESALIHDSEARKACACALLMYLSVNFIFMWTLQPKGPGVPFY